MNAVSINTVLSRLGLRFDDAETEQQYKAWRVATALPFARIGYIGSAPSWMLFMAAVFLLEPATFPQAAPALGGWILLLLLLTALTYWTPLQRFVMPLAALANCVAGFLVAWVLYKVVGIGLDMPVRAGVMTGGVLIVMYFGFAIFRIPPWMATLAISPYVAFAIFYLLQSHLAEVLSLLEAGAFVAILIIAYLGGILVCTVIEIVTRKNFFSELKLGKANEQIQRFVPAAVAKHIISGDDAILSSPRRLHISILFSDIQGFTNLTDTLEPEIASQILDEYMSAMTNIVESHGGTLNEFMGDGLIAMFGAPDALPPKEHAYRALQTAQAMQNRIPALREHWQRQGHALDFKVRIGINTGEASVGSYGSEGRRTYTAIGLAVNVAARIQTQCTPGGILLSYATRELIADKAQCELLGMVFCKGVSEPVKVYAPF